MLESTSRQFGQLECQVLDYTPNGCSISALGIFCHGFGAPGDDLVPLAGEMVRMAGESLAGVRFVFPAAPIQMDPTGFYDSRAWWPIDMVRLQAIMESGDIRDLRMDRPELLETRSTQMKELIGRACEESRLGVDRIVLGGFSQGAMLATEVALDLAEPPGGLVIWSGTLLSESLWRERAANQRPLSIVQSHGRQDPILPFEGAEWLRDMLKSEGHAVSFLPFDGPHTISVQAIQSAVELLAGVAGLNRT